MRILLSVSTAFIILLITICYVFFGADKINVWELRFYKLLELIMLAVLAFSTLRLYNAIVVNNGFLLRLKNEIALFITELRKSNQSQAKSASIIKTSVDNLKGVLSDLKNKINNLTTSNKK